LQINDQINTVVTRYEAFKQGDYSTARNPIPKEFAGSSAGGLSLIDLDEQDPTSSTIGTGIALSGNDLSGLFSAPVSLQPPQQPAFGSSMGAQPPAFHMGLQQTTFPQTQTFSPTPVPANGGFLGSSITGLQQRPTQAGTPPASIVLPATPGSQRGTPIPSTQGQGFFGKAPAGGMGAATGLSFGGTLSQSQPGLSGHAQVQPTSTGLSGTRTPLGGYAEQKQPSFFTTPLQPQPQIQSQTATSGSTSTTQQGKDPFADLAGLF